MPQGETFWNPYRMIPIRGRITRRRPATDERFRGRSGIISCSLENLTLLFVGKNPITSSQFLTRDGRCVIPGSSLKGMLRSLSEIVGGGCFVTNPQGKGREYRDLPDDHYRACKRKQELCIACRMFGMMGRRGDAGVHRGKVSIGDALVQENQLRRTSCRILLMSHGARHASFYTTPGTGALDGLCRKLYFHQPHATAGVPPIPQAVQASMQHDIQTIEPLLPGHHFDFEVQFNNLEEEELQLLVYALALEHEVQVRIEDGHLTLRGPLRHKIGLAKSLGMGSCHITIHRLVMFPDSSQRFASLHALGERTYEGEALTQEIRRLTDVYRIDNSPTMQDLRKMLVWDENDNRVFSYPERYWFQNRANSGTGLKEL